jgi:hypothetical protein
MEMGAISPPEGGKVLSSAGGWVAKEKSCRFECINQAGKHLPYDRFTPTALLDHGSPERHPAHAYAREQGGLLSVVIWGFFQLFQPVQTAFSTASPFTLFANG